METTSETEATREMKTNSEIRKEAKEILRAGWVKRIFLPTCPLCLVLFMGLMVLQRFYHVQQVQTWEDFFCAKISALQSGLGYTVPSSSIFWQMTGATLFDNFVALLFGSLIAFGIAAVYLKVIRKEEAGRFKTAFSGFSRPLELTWLIFLMNLRIFLWGLLLLFPAFIAMYRYRLAWYLKCDHLDWSGGKCIAKSGELMKGVKGRAFLLDLSFIWRGLPILFGYVILAMVSTVSRETIPGASRPEIFAILQIVMALGTFVIVYLFVRLMVYFMIARTIFYREVVDEKI